MDIIQKSLAVAMSGTPGRKTSQMFTSDDAEPSSSITGNYDI
jgi:hypothetical protein